MAAISNWILVGLESTKLGIMTWLLSGGILFTIRWLEFFLDSIIVNLIDRGYSYFNLLLNGELFNQSLVKELLKNIYIFLGIVIFFRLSVILIDYLVDPNKISDERGGSNKLIQRIIFGIIAIALLPGAFNWMNRLQVSIIEDNILNKIIVPKAYITKVNDMGKDAGKVLGNFVLAGFVFPAPGAPEISVRNYNQAVARGRITSLNINTGAGIGVGYNGYHYNYFIVASTVCLFFLLKIMFTYILDIVVRFFNLLFYKLLAPIAIVEYMVGGKDSNVFQKWWKGILGSYFVLFIRMITIWLVIFVIALMHDSSTNINNQERNIAYVNPTIEQVEKPAIINMSNNISKESLAKEEDDSESDQKENNLLATKDPLIRALIIIALLGFMKDFPKKLSDIFGLDFVQESSAGGLMKSIGGAAKGFLTGAAAFGGAAFGSALASGKNLAKSYWSGVGSKFNKLNEGLSKKDRLAKRLENIKKGTPGTNKAFLGSLKQAGSMLPFAGAAMKGFETTYGAASSSDKAIKQKEKEQEEKQLEQNRHQEVMDAIKSGNASISQGNASNSQKLGTVVDDNIGKEMRKNDFLNQVGGNKSQEELTDSDKTNISMAEEAWNETFGSDTRNSQQNMSVINAQRLKDNYQKVRNRSNFRQELTGRISQPGYDRRNFQQDLQEVGDHYEYAFTDSEAQELENDLFNQGVNTTSPDAAIDRALERNETLNNTNNSYAQERRDVETINEYVNNIGSRESISGREIVTNIFGTNEQGKIVDDSSDKRTSYITESVLSKYMGGSLDNKVNVTTETKNDINKTISATQEMVLNSVLSDGTDSDRTISKILKASLASSNSDSTILNNFSGSEVTNLLNRPEIKDHLDFDSNTGEALKIKTGGNHQEEFTKNIVPLFLNLIKK